MISWLMGWNACLVGTVNRRMGWQIGWGSDSLECLTDLVRGVEWLVYDMWYEMLSSLAEWKSERIDWLTDWFVKGQTVWSAWFVWWVNRLIGRWRMERNGWLAGYIDWVGVHGSARRVRWVPGWMSGCVGRLVGGTINRLISTREGGVYAKVWIDTGMHWKSLCTMNCIGC
jgi:hypothetical protein